MTSLDKTIRKLAEDFCKDIVPLIRADLVEKLERGVVQLRKEADLRLEAPKPRLMLPPVVTRKKKRLKEPLAVAKQVVTTFRLPRLPLASDDYTDLTWAEARVLRSLRSIGRPLTSRDLARSIQKGESTVRCQLKKLVSKGHIRRFNDGREVRYTPR